VEESQGDVGAAENDRIHLFLERWRRSEGGERRTYQMFLTELCTLLEVEPPGAVDPDDYGFERRVEIHNLDGSHRSGRIDLYKRGCFVLEAKQGSFKPAPDHPTLPGLAEFSQRKAAGKGHGVRGTKVWDDAMLLASAQAKRYADALPEGSPPFLIVVDIGY